MEAGKAVVKAFGLWEYNAHVFAFEKAVAEENAAETIRILDEMLSALLTPWDVQDCPIYRHMGKEKNSDKHEMNMGAKMLANILDELEKSEKSSFLRNEKDFKKVIQKYREMSMHTE